VAATVRRAVVFFGAVGVIAGGGLLTAGLALATNTFEPGNLTLSPASGAGTLQPTWKTTTACPTGWQGSAAVAEFNTDGTYATRVSGVVSSPTAPITNGTLTGTVGSLLHSTNLPTTGGTVAWAVGCYTQSGGQGNVEWVQLTFVTLTSSGQFSTGTTGPTPSS